jgi:hypothetical protein
MTGSQNDKVGVYNMRAENDTRRLYVEGLV